MARLAGQDCAGFGGSRAPGDQAGALPTVEDTPLALESILVENGDGRGPYGANGAGEGGILAVAAAIGAAVNQAAERPE